MLPLTSQVKAVYPFEVLIPAGQAGLKVASKVKANQIRTVDKRRLGPDPLGDVVAVPIMRHVAGALKIHLAIE